METPTKPRQSRIVIPRLARRPIRISVSDRDSGKRYTYRFQQPLRLGYGQGCEVDLHGGPGPEVLFELERAQGPVRLSTALPLEDLQERVLLSVDGKPLSTPVQDLRPGSRVEIVDRVTNRRYDVVVDPDPFWMVHPPFLIGVLLIAVTIGAAYGTYLYRQLRDAESRQIATERRLEIAESGAKRTEQRLEEALQRMESRQLAMEEAIGEIRALHETAQRDLRNEFGSRLVQITDRARENLSRISEQDTQAREHLAEETETRIAALRQEVSDKLVATYQRFKAMEAEALTTLTARVESIEVEGARFKRILADTQDAIVFVRTTYQAELTRDGEVQEFTSFGTAFLLEPSGLAVAPQHVLFPWRYERELLVLEALGLVRVDADSVRWALWTTGERVIDPGADTLAYLTETAYQNVLEDRAMRFLYAPEPTLGEAMVSSPLGYVSIALPLPGPSDIAVFQLMDFDRNFAHLRLSPAPTRVEPLDDVLVVGYPLSKLQDGRTIPQAVRGFIRRISGGVMELDSALHPGLSGGPILNRDGDVIGMAIATMESEVYGMAVLSRDLKFAIDRTREAIRLDEERLLALGCDPGPADGRIDAQAWQAYRCEAGRAGETQQ